MLEVNYPSPVDKLLTYGDCRALRGWQDYLSLGINPEHIPDLIRMATDEALHHGDPEGLEVWAPVHAWRTLGELRAQEAIEPLLRVLLHLDEDFDEYVVEEFPEVYGRLGPEGIVALNRILRDDSHQSVTRRVSASSLCKIGLLHPDTRSECVDLLTQALLRFEVNDPSLNGSLISELLDLGAVESAGAMEQAFASDRVDEFVAGDWEDVQVELGLIEERETPPPGRSWRTWLSGETVTESPPEARLKPQSPPPPKSHRKDKTKRKMANASRKKNRKKK